MSLSEVSVKEQLNASDFQAGKVIGENLAELCSNQDLRVAGMIIDLYDASITPNSNASVSEALANGIWHGFAYDEPRSITRSLYHQLYTETTL